MRNRQGKQASAKPKTKRQPKPGSIDGKWLSIPAGGEIYYGLSRNASYDAAERGEIPVVRVGRLLRVPVAAMEAKMAEAGPLVPRPQQRTAA